MVENKNNKIDLYTNPDKEMFANNSKYCADIIYLPVNPKYLFIIFTKEIHKFGTISEGEIVVCEFYFRNVGDANLIIKAIESSCGCTVIKWQKQPIKPKCSYCKCSRLFHSQFPPNSDIITVCYIFYAG